MNGIYLLCLLFTLILIELLGIAIWGKYPITKKRIIGYILSYFFSILIYLITYIGANFSFPSMNEIFAFDNARLAIYIGFFFHIVRILFLHRKELKERLSTESLSKYLCSFLIITCIVVAAEMTLFNFRHFQSAFYHPIYPQEFTVSDNLLICDTATYEVTAEGDTYIEINNINAPVHNIHGDYIFPQVGEYGVEDISYHYSVQDQGNSASYYDLPSRVFYHLAPQSQYTHVNLYGDCISLRIYFESLNVGEIIAVRSLIFNARYPLMLSFKRSMFLIFACFILLLLRPKSSLYHVLYMDKFKWKKWVLTGCFMMQAFFFWRVVNYNLFFVNMTEYTGLQYHHLTESLQQGHTYLNLEVPQSLIDLEDPYDASVRDSSMQEGEGYPHDVAYYNGHYYVYFGVGPVIVFFLPYNLITGAHMPIHIALYLSAMLVALAVMGLLSQIIKKWYPKTPLLIYLMFACLFTNGFGLLYAMQRPDFYSLPIVLAAASSLGGLYFWMSSVEKEKISAWRLCVGSLCMAFVAACRPQFLLGSFLAIVLFWDVVFKERKLFSKKSLFHTICFILPYVLVAAGVMYYNDVRFGSVFDFGANYNLTYNNMPYRGWRLDRLLYSIFGFLFYPFGVTNSFPFIEPGHYVTTYQGISVDEALTGGIIYNQLYLLPTLFLFKLKKYFKDLRAYRLAVTATVFAIVIMLVDAQMAGVLARYFIDFAWLLMISGFMILAAIYQELNQENHRYYFRCVFYGCFIWSMTNRLLSIFTDLGLSLKDTNGLLFQRVAHLVEFWN